MTKTPSTSRPRAGTLFTFRSPFSQHEDRNGQTATVLRVIRKADDDHDAEVLPMYVARFGDGAVIECWPEELGV